MSKKNIRKDNSAVSAVIGTILMVSITVVISAAVGAMAYEMSGDMHPMYFAVVTAKQTNATTIEFTFMGGPDADSLRYLDATIDGVAIVGMPSRDEIDLGSVWTYTDEGLNGRNHLVVTATFVDDTSQVILNTYL